MMVSCKKKKKKTVSIVKKTYEKNYPFKVWWFSQAFIFSFITIKNSLNSIHL